MQATCLRPLIYCKKAHSPLLNFLFQDVMHTICEPSGEVLRIVIFKKRAVQAMVEYPFNCFV